MLCLSVFVVALLGSAAAVVPSDSPKCDADIDAKLKKVFSDPVPKDLMGETSKAGPWSLVTVVAPNLEKLNSENQVCSHYVVDKEKKSLTSVRKMVPGALPQKFTIVETDDKFHLTAINDKGYDFTVQGLYLKDGVAVVSKCCEDCTGDGMNLGVAVADKKKGDKATFEAVMEVRAKLQTMKLDVPIGALVSCADKEL